jgi:hypothetical protein
MKILLLVALLFAAVLSYRVDVCPHTLEEMCIDDVNKGKTHHHSAYNSCDEAAKEKGKDTPTDLDCIKYFVGLRTDCWPCICQMAAYEGWTIKGCKARNI